MCLAGRDGGWLLEGLVEGMDSRSIMLMYRLRQGRMDEKSKSIRRKKKNFSALYLKLRRYVDECNEFLRHEKKICLWQNVKNFFMFKLYSLLYICINEYKSQFVTRKYIYILFINQFINKFIPNEIKYLI